MAPTESFKSIVNEANYYLNNNVDKAYFVIPYIHLARMDCTKMRVVFETRQ
jgi:hypothetical protein